MINVTHIDHIVLRTTQIQKMLDFYGKVLGGTIEKQQPALKLTQMRFGDNLIDLVEVEDKIEQNGNLDHFCLRIKSFDLDALTQYLNSHGVTIHDQGPRYGAQGMGYSIYIKDPEGNGIELRELK